MLLGCLLAWPDAGWAQGWVTSRPGPAPGDSGPRIDAIVGRSLLNIPQSPARLEDGSKVLYNHPSMLCQTRAGTLIFMWNGGLREAGPSNRIFYTRLEKNARQWSEPQRLEKRQIDFGTLWQPRKDGAPIIAGYWLGAPRGAGSAMICSDDDGKTWSEPRPFPTSDDAFWAAAPANKHLRFSMSPPVEFADGTLWFASEQQHKLPAIVEVPPDNYRADPKGTPWKSYHSNGLAAGVHGDFLVLSPDRSSLMYIMRGGGNYLTKDRGKSWTEVKGVQKGGAGVAALSLDKDGGAAQGWHVTAGCTHPGRNGLFVWISKDPTDPASWKKVLTLHQDLPDEDADPSMIQTADRKIHLLFTGRHEDCLKHYVLDPDKLVADAADAKEPRGWPAQATNLKATAIDAGVELTWTDNADNEKGYIIWRKLQAGDSDREKVGEVPANATSFKDTKPGQAGRYVYHVQVFTERDEGRNSSPAAVQASFGAAAASAPAQRAKE
jgi:hypothetical protein